jgi:hypothetical protein
MKHTRKGKDDRPGCPAIGTIEFIGGPYDGHKEPCLTQTARLPADVVWCVSDDALRMLEGEESQPGLMATALCGRSSPSVTSMRCHSRKTKSTTSTFMTTFTAESGERYT